MRMWIALILLSLAALAGALRPVAPKLETRSRWMPALRLEKGSGSGDDFDSSGMTAMSSSEIKEMKMKQQLEAEKKEEEMISSILKKSFELNAKVKSDIAGKSKPTKAATPTPAAPPATPATGASSTKASEAVAFPTSSPAAAAKDDEEKQLANFSAGSGAFDFGLLIAFPVIIGTLALFFVFPFVGEKLAGGSGPLPPGM